jgi:hypothetical protein
MKTTLLLIAALITASSAMAQSEYPPEGRFERGDRPPVERGDRGPRFSIDRGDRGARFSIDRGRGQGRIDIRCADGDTTRACLEAVLPIIEGGQDQTGVVYATTGLKCGDGTIYEVSTGTNKGTCGPAAGSGGKKVTCVQGGKEVASASCDSGCGTQDGAGSCKILK